MTISIALKVGDGVVLGTDSFSMLLAPDGQAAGFSFRAEKLFQLLPGLPVGLLVAGVGDLQGGRSHRMYVSCGTSWFRPHRHAT